MKIEQVELFHISMELVHPFETSFGRWTHRDGVLVCLHAQGMTGWGECAAMPRPVFTAETTQTAWHILRDFVIPATLGKAWQSIDEFVAFTDWIRGHPMAKGAFQSAAWDLLAQRDGVSLAAKLAEASETPPRKRVPVGVSVGIQPTIDDTLARVGRFLEQGYRRIKLKIEPGRDVDLARAARAAFPDVSLMLDANSAYTLADAALLQQLDDLDLLMIEQPLAHDDIFEHSKLAAQLKTPICLDESIETPSSARWALEIGAARIINIKPGRVGGPLESRQIHDICQASNTPVWCGGMQETGIGRAANLAISSLPNFTLPSDISATDRYWKADIIDELFELNTKDSTITVPNRPGLGVTVNRERIRRYQLRTESFKV